MKGVVNVIQKFTDMGGRQHYFGGFGKFALTIQYVVGFSFGRF